MHLSDEDEEDDDGGDAAHQAGDSLLSIVNTRGRRKDEKRKISTAFWMPTERYWCGYPSSSISTGVRMWTHVRAMEDGNSFILCLLSLWQRTGRW
jgi:hypothetical protein